MSILANKQIYVNRTILVGVLLFTLVWGSCFHRDICVCFCTQWYLMRGSKDVLYQLVLRMPSLGMNASDSRNSARLHVNTDTEDVSFFCRATEVAAR